LSFDVPKRELEVLGAEEFLQRGRGTDFGHDTDWFDEITRIGITQRHTVQVTGGTSNNNYRATVDFRDATGVDIRADRREIGARLTINHQAPNNLYRVIVNVAPRKIDRNNSDRNMFWQVLTLNPTMPVWCPDRPGMYYRVTGWEAENPVENLRLELDGREELLFDWDGTFRLNLLPLFARPGREHHSLSTQVTIAQQINHDFRFWYRPSTSNLAIQAARTGQARQDRRYNMQQSIEWIGNYAMNHNGQS
jgi:hypothetical protein